LFSIYRFQTFSDFERFSVIDLRCLCASWQQTTRRQRAFRIKSSEGKPASRNKQNDRKRSSNDKSNKLRQNTNPKQKTTLQQRETFFLLDLVVGFKFEVISKRKKKLKMNVSSSWTSLRKGSQVIPIDILETKIQQTDTEDDLNTVSTPRLKTDTDSPELSSLNEIRIATLYGLKESKARASKIKNSNSMEKKTLYQRLRIRGVVKWSCTMF
jgi:hypothetical protein